MTLCGAGRVYPLGHARLLANRVRGAHCEPEATSDRGQTGEAKCPLPQLQSAAVDRSGQIKRLFDVALQHHRSGRFAQAWDGYREILAIDPNHVESLHHLGVVALQTGVATWQ